MFLFLPISKHETFPFHLISIKNHWNPNISEIFQYIRRDCYTNNFPQYTVFRSAIFWLLSDGFSCFNFPWQHRYTCLDTVMNPMFPKTQSLLLLLFSLLGSGYTIILMVNDFLLNIGLIVSNLHYVSLASSLLLSDLVSRIQN